MGGLMAIPNKEHVPNLEEFERTITQLVSTKEGRKEYFQVFRNGLLITLVRLFTSEPDLWSGNVLIHTHAFLTLSNITIQKPTYFIFGGYGPTVEDAFKALADHIDANPDQESWTVASTLIPLIRQGLENGFFKSIEPKPPQLKKEELS